MHRVDAALEASRDSLDALELKYGKILDIEGGVAHSPAVHAYAALQDVLREHPTIDAKTREAIASEVGDEEDCDLCQAAQTPGVAGRGTQRGRDGRRLPGHRAEPKPDPCSPLASEFTARVGNTSDESWQTALDAAWPDDRH